MDNLGGTPDGEARPLLHGRTVYVLLSMLRSRSQVSNVGRVTAISPKDSATYIEGHPRNRLVMRDLSTLNQLQRQLFIVEGHSEYGAWRRPCSYH